MDGPRGPASQAIDLGYLYTSVGNDLGVMADKQKVCAGQRVEWRLR